MKVCMKKQNTEAVGMAFGACNVPQRDYADIINVCKADGSSTVVKYEHNFTTQGVTSDDFFTIAGSAGKKKGTATYDGLHIQTH